MIQSGPRQPDHIETEDRDLIETGGGGPASGMPTYQITLKQRIGISLKARIQNHSNGRDPIALFGAVIYAEAGM